MSSINKVILVGRLGRDPEIRTMQNGDKVCNLSVATSEGWKDKASGEWKDKTEWHKVVSFNENACNYAEKNLHKGDMVYVDGQLQTKKYTDKDGVEKYSTEIVISKFKGELKGLCKTDPDDDRSSSPVAKNATPATKTEYDNDSDSIPF